MSENYDEKMQRLCDQIRRNLTEDEMINILEDAGFAVDESGQELIEALAEAVEQGDVCESCIE